MTSPILTELTNLFSDTSTVPYSDTTRWMRSSENVEVVQSFLGASDRKETRNFLAYMLMYKEAAEMFEAENPLDVVLKRLVEGLYRRVSDHESSDAILSASNRMLPVFEAWKKRDKNVLLTYLSDRAVKAMVTDDEDGMTADTLCTWIEQIGGDEVAARARERCSRQWTRTTREQLPSIIQETMERAYWDHIKQAIAEQDLAPFFDALTQVQQAVNALLSAAPKTRGDFEDRFDVAWIEDRAKNDVLSRQDVGSLVHYLVTIVGSIQAPADDAEVQPWVKTCQDVAIQNTPLTEYLPAVVDVIRESITHLRRVFQRLQALSDNPPSNA